MSDASRVARGAGRRGGDRSRRLRDQPRLGERRRRRGREAARRTVRHGHRVRRGVAHGVLRHPGQAVRGGAPRGDGEVRLRGQLGAGREHRAGRAGRRVRLGQHEEHGLGGRRLGRVRPDDLRQERHGDRGAAGQPRRRHQPGGSRQARPEDRAVPAAGALRRDRAAGLRQREDRRQAGHAGRRRQGGAGRGAARRGRRRRGLPDRRPGRGRQGHRDRDSGRAERVDVLPDRGPDEGPERRGGPRVRRLRAVRGRDEGADRGRLRQAVTGLRGPDRLSSAPHRTRRASAPWPLAGPAVLAVAFLLLPLAGLLVRAPWRSLPALLGDPLVREALRLSLLSASLATALAVLVGVPLAWVLARTRLPGRPLLRALVTLPLVLPETFVAMPFLIITVEGALRASDVRYEEASASLGASRWTTFRRVTLPLVAPSVTAGAVLCWARALGEFGATITFAGNFPGTTQTMPIAVYIALETDPGAAIALSLVLLVVSIVILTALRDRIVRSGPVS